MPPDAVVLLKLSTVALVPVDVMDAVARLEPKICVAPVGLRPAAHAENIDRGILLGIIPV